MSARTAPAPGQAPLPARATPPRCCAATARTTRRSRPPAIRFGDRTWTHAEYFAESCRWANLFLANGPSTPDGVLHVGVLLDNTPDYLFAFGGAALIGAAVVGLNHTRRGEHLLRDIEHTALRPGRHRAAARGAARADRRSAAAGPRVGRFADADDPRRRSAHRWPALAARDADPGHRARRRHDLGADLHRRARRDAPKAVICSQRRLLVTGKRMAMIMDLGPDDIGYVCMPLFHSNAVQVGWAPSIVHGVRGRARPAVLRVGLAARRPPLRRRPTSTTPASRSRISLAQPEQPDDADNPLRVAFGNEGSPEVVDELRPPLRRRGDRRVRRDRGRRRGQPRRRACRPARSGTRRRHVQGRRRRRQREAACAEFDDDGRLRQRRRVRRRDRQHRRASARSRATTTTPRRPRRRRASAGTGRATSATSTPTATSTSRAATPTGSASTARTSRPARSRRRCATHPDVVLAAVYGVPDDQAGDQVMAGARAAPTARRSTRRRSRRGSTRRRRSARSGGRATCASCAIRRPPARTRS